VPLFLVRFTNKLPTLHPLPVDSTLPGAELAQNRTSAHLHGGHVPWTSEGGLNRYATVGNDHCAQMFVYSTRIGVSPQCGRLGQIGMKLLAELPIPADISS
jgi:hypothetical protein